MMMLKWLTGLDYSDCQTTSAFKIKSKAVAPTAHQLSFTGNSYTYATYIHVAHIRKYVCTHMKLWTLTLWIPLFDILPHKQYNTHRL